MFRLLPFISIIISYSKKKLKFHVGRKIIVLCLRLSNKYHVKYEKIKIKEWPKLSNNYWKV